MESIATVAAVDETLPLKIMLIIKLYYHNQRSNLWKATKSLLKDGATQCWRETI